MTQLILVGGFLGAGKTTALARMAQYFLEQGQRVGLITNDQAAELVDTGLLRQAQLAVLEIAGGCFCCRFDQLIATATELVNSSTPDIIIGEPVGSCTDLAATVLQPIKDLYAEQFHLAPLSVLVDPRRLWEVLEPRRHSPLHASARYILRKQLEEADIIVVNKLDTLDAADRAELLTAAHDAFPTPPIFYISALSGEGMDTWLAAVLSQTPAGTHIVEVDYDIYAEGEAVLGWLNATATVTDAEADWQSYGWDILQRLRRAAISQGAQVAHVKLSLTASEGQLVGNLTSNNSLPALRGQLNGAPRSTLVLNARVEMAPAALQALVEAVLRDTTRAGMTVQIDTLRSLSPGRPTPTHRYTAVV